MSSLTEQGLVVKGQTGQFMKEATWTKCASSVIHERQTIPPVAHSNGKNETQLLQRRTKTTPHTLQEGFKVVQPP